MRWHRIPGPAAQVVQGVRRGRCFMMNRQSVIDGSLAGGEGVFEAASVSLDVVGFDGADPELGPLA